MAKRSKVLVGRGGGAGIRPALGRQVGSFGLSVGPGLQALARPDGSRRAKAGWSERLGRAKPDGELG